MVTLDLKLAARSKDQKRVSVAAPIVNAPMMLAEWQLEPDEGQRLVYDRGSLTPVGGVLDISGFAGLARMFGGDDAAQAVTFILAVLVLVGISLDEIVIKIAKILGVKIDET